MIRSLLLLSTIVLSGTTALAQPSIPSQSGVTCRFRSMMDDGPNGVVPCKVVSRGGQLEGFYFPEQNEMISRNTPGYRVGGQSGQCLEHIDTNTSICPVR